MSPDEYARIMAAEWDTTEAVAIFGPYRWAVTTMDSPSGVVVAVHMCEDVAQHIADLHNAWLLDIQTLTEGILD